MKKQITLSELSDELVQTKKEFLIQIDQIVPWGRVVKDNRPALLQTRAGG